MFVGGILDFVKFVLLLNKEYIELGIGTFGSLMKVILQL